MKMPAEQIERIKGLGYTESEAHFLYIVARPFWLLHSSSILYFHARSTRQAFVPICPEASSE